MYVAALTGDKPHHSVYDYQTLIQSRHHQQINIWCFLREKRRKAPCLNPILSWGSTCSPLGRSQGTTHLDKSTSDVLPVKTVLKKKNNKWNLASRSSDAIVETVQVVVFFFLFCLGFFFFCTSKFLKTRFSCFGVKLAATKVNRTHVINTQW